MIFSFLSLVHWSRQFWMHSGTFPFEISWPWQLVDRLQFCKHSLSLALAEYLKIEISFWEHLNFEHFWLETKIYFAYEIDKILKNFIWTQNQAKKYSVFSNWCSKFGLLFALLRIFRLRFDWSKALCSSGLYQEKRLRGTFHRLSRILARIMSCMNAMDTFAYTLSIRTDILLWSEHLIEIYFLSHNEWGLWN